MSETPRASQRVEPPQGVSVIATNHDLHAAVRLIVRGLRSQGEMAVADDLEGALSVSSLPGEILGEVGLQLQRVQRTAAGNRAGVREVVGDALRYIAAALGQ